MLELVKQSMLTKILKKEIVELSGWGKIIS
jgi:hypothetical protein